MALPQSNYTQFPNIILDNLYLLSGSELKVISAICRQTIGFHQEKKRLSISLLMRLTGLSNKCIVTTCASLCMRDWIEKFESPQGNEYSLKLECPELVDSVHHQESEPVKKVHHQVEVPMKNFHTPYEKSSQVPVKKFHTYKEKKETYKEVSLNRANVEGTPDADAGCLTMVKNVMDLGIEVNQGLKSRIMSLPIDVVKVSIVEYQQMAKKKEPKNTGAYFNRILTQNFEALKSPDTVVKPPAEDRATKPAVKQINHGEPPETPNHPLPLPPPPSVAPANLPNRWIPEIGETVWFQDIFFTVTRRRLLPEGGIVVFHPNGDSFPLELCRPYKGAMQA